ncbi:phosphate transport system permease protein [Modicisalibacter muralis]|uniref:Phosphate transport system permease protein n=1 Tax=Modicisalibacter muralis TaxID=119000 RepID=A0A1G9KRW4_9GAMM|nr:ABC transporter permease subunit [Halomonas muralis]SDL52369.1 phosphate transport system permease protein [Halomonas muralis]
MIDFSPSATRLRRRLRHSRDRLATLLISAGGIGVIAAVLAIGVFLTLEVLPLLAPSRVTAESPARPAPPLAESVAWLRADARGGLTLLADDGRLWQGHVGETGETGMADQLDRLPAALLGGQSISAVAADASAPLLALGLDGSEVLLVPRAASGEPQWSHARRHSLFAGTPVAGLTFGSDDRHWWLAGHDRNGRVAVLRGARATDDGNLGDPPQRFTLPVSASQLALNNAGRLVVGDGQRLEVWALNGETPRHLGGVRALDSQRITALAYLVGGETLLVGDSGGGVRRWLNARGDRAPLIGAEPYSTPSQAAITRIAPLPDRRLALVLDAAGGMALYQAVAGRRWQGQAPDGEPLALSFTPDGERLWWLGEAGLTQFAIDAEHAEVSWQTLWTPILYEGHDEPQQRWQGDVSGVESEPRFGLAPLAWGTLKAAAWALVFAVPLALGAAIHSASYMSTRLRARIKPTIELMEALPGVVIGFIAGLVLAPYIERHLAGALALAVVLPLGLLLGGALWSRSPHRLRERLPLGWAGVWLVPWLALLVWLALTLSPTLETGLFAGDLRAWLQARLGLDYAARNAMIVGLAMGFAVIPTIYSLAEDALSGLPGSLGEGAQALGATRWQALWRVLLPAASPGIFSAVMIGAGRAIGETMIVLMATGNTAVMSWSPFEGLRSIAANIAIELPEAALGGTHYRLLLLSALLLFVFTFCINTLAELVRMRLKRRYRRLEAGA